MLQIKFKKYLLNKEVYLLRLNYKQLSTATHAAIVCRTFVLLF